VNNCIITITYPHWYTLKIQLLKYSNTCIYIYILEGFIDSRICNHHICHSNNTYIKAKYETTQQSWVNNCIINITFDKWYTSKGKATEECQYIYILEGLIVPGICSHNTCHSNNTCFNAKCENYTTKLGV